jgi:hypothetical protein
LLVGDVGLEGFDGEFPKPDPLLDPNPDPPLDPNPDPLLDPNPDPELDPKPDPLLEPNPPPVPDPNPVPLVLFVPFVVPFRLLLPPPAIAEATFWFGSNTNSH